MTDETWVDRIVVGSLLAIGVLAVGILAAALTEPLIPAMLKPLLDQGFTAGALPLWLVPVAIIGTFALPAFAGPTHFTHKHAPAREGRLNLVEDFADMLHAVPGAYFVIGHDGSMPVHNPGYILDDKILPVGASMFARIIETRLPVGSHA